MTVGRRLAAILAADVVGYSRLMGEDEAGTAPPRGSRRECYQARHNCRLSARSPLRSERPLNVDTGRSAEDFLCRNPRHHHARHFRVQQANAIAPDGEIRGIENISIDEIQHRAIDLRPLRLR